MAFCDILALNKDLLEDFSSIFCFVMKISSCRSICTARGPCPSQLKFNNLFNEHFSSWFIFKSIFLRKNWRDGVELFLVKNNTINGYAS